MTLQIMYGIFCVLHGLVHLLYFGQSARYFELQTGMMWPDGAWVFSRLLGDGTTGMLANTLLVVTAIGFVAGGVGILMTQAWWQWVVVSVAVLSSIIYILLWDGELKELDDKGGIGILINVTTLVGLLVFEWPNFEF